MAPLHIIFWYAGDSKTKDRQCAQIIAHDQPPENPGRHARVSFLRRAILGRAMAAYDLCVPAEEPWPTRTLTIVVPFPPGGTADFAARPLAAYLSEAFGKSVVVENKGGAGGGIGHAYVARAEPDGYIIMTALPSLAVIPEANRLAGKPVTYEMDQFLPLARMFADPMILAVKKSSSWTSLEEFIAAVKNSPGQIPYGSSGHLGTVHLAMEMFLNAAGLKMVHVPYQGGGPALSALFSGSSARTADLGVHREGPHRNRKPSHPGPMGHATTAQLSATLRRLQEAGYPDVIYILWAGVFAPRKTPAHVTVTLRDAIRTFMQRQSSGRTVLESWQSGVVHGRPGIRAVP